MRKLAKEKNQQNRTNGSNIYCERFFLYFSCIFRLSCCIQKYFYLFVQLKYVYISSVSLSLSLSLPLFSVFLCGILPEQCNARRQKQPWIRQKVFSIHLIACKHIRLYRLLIISFCECICRKDYSCVNLYFFFYQVP